MNSKTIWSRFCCARMWPIDPSVFTEHDFAPSQWTTDLSTDPSTHPEYVLSSPLSGKAIKPNYCPPENESDPPNSSDSSDLEPVQTEEELSTTVEEQTTSKGWSLVSPHDHSSSRACRIKLQLTWPRSTSTIQTGKYVTRSITSSIITHHAFLLLKHSSILHSSSSTSEASPGQIAQLHSELEATCHRIDHLEIKNQLLTAEKGAIQAQFTLQGIELADICCKFSKIFFISDLLIYCY